ncbi:MAG: DNA polymerase III subunit delta [Myxococcales bacterium]|nr:DNA polymerase III subunit delta [Myxococcales bacterium]MCB9650762.1 DNA polymerase III subunit delta [Deltaproteobacteria bacterium]
MAAKKKPSAADPREALRHGPPGPVYALDGDERLMVDEAVAALKAAAVPVHAADFNFDAFNAREAKLARIMEAAQTLPAFAQRRMVLVTEAEHIDPEGAQELLSYLESPSPTTVLVLVAGGNFDARTKLYKALEKAGAAVRYARPTLREMPDAVRARADAMGLKVESGAVRALVDALGTDVSGAAQALEVLSLYVGPGSGRPITAADVASLITVTREENIFQLVDAIGAKDKAAALAGLHAMLSNEQAHPLQLLALVARHYRNLMKTRAAQAAGVPRDALGKLVGVPPFAVDKLIRQAKGYSGRGLSDALGAITAADRALKGGRLESTRAMERLVLQLMS